MNNYIQKINSYLNDLNIKKRHIKHFSFPKTIQIELTNNCNVNCSMCARSLKDFPNSNYMRKETFKRLTPFLRTCENVFIAGHGEPSLHKNFYNYIKIIKSFNCKLHIATNGFELPENTAELFKKNNVQSCIIGFDAIDNNIFKEIRGFSNISIIRLINELRKNNIDIILNIVLMKKNMSDIKNIINSFPFIKHLSIFHPKIYKDKLLKESLLYDYNKTEFRKWRNEIIFLMKKNNILYTLPEEKGVVKTCSQPLDMLVFRYNGDVLGCCNAVYTSGKYNIYSGNILKDNLWNIINSKEIIKFRKAFYGRSNYPDPCKKCPLRFVKIKFFKRY